MDTDRTEQAGAASHRAPEAPAPTTAMVMDSSRWNRVCFAMNASTVRRNSSASSAPQHSRAVTDDRRRRPFSDSDRRMRSSWTGPAGGGDDARRDAIFSDLLRRGAARASFLDAAGFSSNAADGASATHTARRGGEATTAGATSTATGGGGGVMKEEAAGSGNALGGAVAGVAKGEMLGAPEVASADEAAALVWLDEEDAAAERSRSRLDSARSSSTMALPRTKTKRALRRSEPATRSAAAAADGTREVDQVRNTSSARSSPTRSVRYRSRRRSAAPTAAMRAVDSAP
ncbi:hypothetical protein U9M48_044986 [Paspalum notatum var. saurae]|uniref:Uncharacterized protein n=1 Tax=Paspalum notatum var. saurae TaxID=547442 RepID=A0AAQ3V0D3_PASNO